MDFFRCTAIGGIIDDYLNPLDIFSPENPNLHSLAIQDIFHQEVSPPLHIFSSDIETFIRFHEDLNIRVYWTGKLRGSHYKILSNCRQKTNSILVQC